MSFDVTTLALAKSYADQHGGGGGASTAGDFIIKMTVEGNDDIGYTVTSCDKTVEQIDAAFNADKNIVLTVGENGETNKYVLSLVNAMPGFTYIFQSFFDVYLISANIDKSDGTFFSMIQMPASAIAYSNDALPNASNVKSALDDTIDTQQTQSADLESLRAGISALMDAYQTQGGDITSLKTQAHTHANKGTLDNLSDSNGKLQYNGSDVGLKPVKGTDYWTESDKAEIVADTLAVLPTWTGGNY